MRTYTTLFRSKNVLKKNPNEEPVRAQYAFYEYLKEKNDRNRL